MDTTQVDLTTTIGAILFCFKWLCIVAIVYILFYPHGIRRRKHNKGEDTDASTNL